MAKFLNFTKIRNRKMYPVFNMPRCLLPSPPDIHVQAQELVIQVRTLHVHTPPHWKREVILGVCYTMHKSVSLFLPPRTAGRPRSSTSDGKNEPTLGCRPWEKTEGEVGGQEQGSEERWERRVQRSHEEDEEGKRGKQGKQAGKDKKTHWWKNLIHFTGEETEAQRS